MCSWGKEWTIRHKTVKTQLPLMRCSEKKQVTMPDPCSQHHWGGGRTTSHPSSPAQRFAPTLTSFKEPAHCPLQPGSEQGNVLLIFSPSWFPTKPCLNSRLASCACSVTQSCLTLCDPMDCSPPGSSVQRISQARIQEWIAISFPQGIFSTQEWNPHLLHHLHCRQIL